MKFQIVADPLLEEAEKIGIFQYGFETSRKGQAVNGPVGAAVWAKTGIELVAPDFFCHIGEVALLGGFYVRQGNLRPTGCAGLFFDPRPDPFPHEKRDLFYGFFGFS